MAIKKTGVPRASPVPKSWVMASVPRPSPAAAAAKKKRKPAAAAPPAPLKKPAKKKTANAGRVVRNATGHPAAHRKIVAARPDVASAQLRHTCDTLFGKGPVLVLVYNDGCMFCNRMRPDWNHAASDIVPKLNVDVVEIESLAVGIPGPGTNPMVDTIHTKFAGSVPYIGLLRADKSIETYSGDRSSKDIVAFVRSDGRPPS
jgi:hypothetical protein